MIRGQLRQAHPTSDPSFSYQVDDRNGTFQVTLDGAETTLTIHSEGTGEGWCRTADGSSHAFASRWVANALHLWLDGNLFIFERVETTQRNPRQPVNIGGDVLAPMPGIVVQVLVEMGGLVELGDRLIIMESMKMELVIDAPKAGVVKRIAVTEGSQVDKGMRLLELEEPTTEDEV
ncbi:MAG: hypothetical protein O2909_12270 [Chloroflexi bacterium]|nr:hypothetical protein [Chloroflexota bacterium]